MQRCQDNPVLLKLFQKIHIFTFSILTAGEQGVPGDRGPTGPPGPKGIQGESGKVGVTFIRWGRKTCPNSGATLVYEGDRKI